MRLTLRIWRQSGPHEAGRYEEFEVRDARPEMSVLELLDVLNGDLVDAGIEPVAFDSDCREGICGACGVTVDGRPHGPAENTPSCHQRLTPYADGDKGFVATVLAKGGRLEHLIFHQTGVSHERA